MTTLGSGLALAAFSGGFISTAADGLSSAAVFVVAVSASGEAAAVAGEAAALTSAAAGTASFAGGEAGSGTAWSVDASCALSLEADVATCWGAPEAGTSPGAAAAGLAGAGLSGAGMSDFAAGSVGGSGFSAAISVGSAGG
ncbi:MAG: hypothetical protein WCA28_27045 [Bradyrhizobium sp.]